MPAAISKTNMRQLAAIMAKRAPGRVLLSPEREVEWKAMVHEMSQGVVAAADEPEFVRLCNNQRPR